MTPTLKPSSFEQLLEHIPFGIIFVEAGRVAYLNNTVENITGLSRDRMVGSDLSVAQFPAQVTVALQKSLAGRQSTTLYEVPYLNYFGTHGLFNVYLVPLEKRSDAIMIVLQDMSFFKKVDDLRHDRTHIDKLAFLFACMAHEIKNPLGVIKGTVQLMKKENTLSDDEAYEIVMGETSRIEKVIQELLDYSNPRISMSSVDIPAVIDSVLAAVEHEVMKKRIEICRIYDHTLPELQGDADTLYRTFFNIVKNAVEADRPGGRLTVRVKVNIGLKYREGSKSYNYLLIDIADTGVGISEEQRARLFTPFFTTKPGGTGLGLVYAQKVVMDHDGMMTVDSTINEGTSVKILLPLKG